MKEYISIFLKGIAMGVANVIPGVSGGTIALVTNVYERLINSLKSFDIKALRYLLSRDFKKLATYIDLKFLSTILLGTIISVFSIASLFKYLFENKPILIWAFFFGLILASVYYVGKRVVHWNIINIMIFVFGCIIAVSISFMDPTSENSNIFFILLCGVIGVSGMLLPGLSGSFILILLGNYELILVTSIIEFNIKLLSVFCLGSILGLIGFSHIIAWLLKYHKDKTLSILCGFILGSLYIVWPWKNIKESIFINGDEKILSYSWILPKNLDIETISAIFLIFLGILVVYLLENISTKE